MSSTTTSTYTISNMPTSNHFDMEPSNYLFQYSKSMHEHTKKQMEAASSSARRRSANANGTNAHATLRSGGSSMDSNESSNSYRRGS
ncbi:hypothetical protein CJF31_00002373 [Rutstroemia sp. NJR-2017a BVV2]|nr:hypothetical protein CJF31_00002373 [Rutstroemia sp. NJR-2017a BVV2]